MENYVKQMKEPIKACGKNPAAHIEVCPICGSTLIQPCGTCKVCLNCGTTTGCGL